MFCMWRAVGGLGRGQNRGAASSRVNNLKPSKKRGERIDGIVAAVMALGRAVLRPDPDDDAHLRWRWRRAILVRSRKRWFQNAVDVQRKTSVGRKKTSRRIQRCVGLSASRARPAHVRPVAAR